jgi:ABC-2 type transport system ATP-binding protein
MYKAMISAKSLRIDYDSVIAVNDLNLEIPEGQIYGLVGPNGAGKTSTLKALAGIIEPTYGEIKIGDFDFDLKRQEALQLVGFVHDFPPVYENLKVWEFLDVFGAAYLLDRNERLTRARDWIEQVNLTEKWNSLIRELSRGMRQRLILAKTLLHDPSVLFLDEPASGLDPIGRVELRDILKQVSKEGKTIIISSHILTELSDFCNAIGIMEKGKMVVSGTIEEIRTHIGSKGKLKIILAEHNAHSCKQLKETISNSKLVANPREKAPGQFESDFLGTSTQAAELLTEIMKKKLSVAAFHVEQENIEDIFLKIGAKDVS